MNRIYSSKIAVTRFVAYSYCQLEVFITKTLHSSSSQTHTHSHTQTPSTLNVERIAWITNSLPKKEERIVCGHKVWQKLLAHNTASHRIHSNDKVICENEMREKKRERNRRIENVPTRITMSVPECLTHSNFQLFRRSNSHLRNTLWCQRNMNWFHHIQLILIGSMRVAPAFSWANFFFFRIFSLVSLFATIIINNNWNWSIRMSIPVSA